MQNKLFFCKIFFFQIVIQFACSRFHALVWYWVVSKGFLSLNWRVFHFFVWCMKVSRESSRAYMKLVWWTGDWVPAKQEELLVINQQTNKQTKTNKETNKRYDGQRTGCLQRERSRKCLLANKQTLKKKQTHKVMDNGLGACKERGFLC